MRTHRAPDVLATLFGTMPHGVVYLGLEGDAAGQSDFRVLYTNPAFHRLTGKQLAVGSLWSAQPDADTPQQRHLQHVLARVMRDNSSSTSAHFQPGLEKWLQLTAYCPSAGHLMLVFSENAVAPAADAMLQQSTQHLRKALLDSEAKLQEMNETLESRVQERTRELVVALNNAELAKRSRGQFLANMSHEIRTPMNSVMGMVYLALKTDPSPVLREFLEKIQSSGAHLLGIINDILDFSKIDAGKLQLESGIFDLQQVMQRIVQLADGRATEKGLSLRLDIGPEVPKLLYGDALRLGQILINFLNNATKFTEEGGVVIRVQLLAAPSDAPSADSCLLRFEVEDSGIGISDSQRVRLFESFEQGDQSTTRNFGGTGLGLAISRQLALLMGGEVGLSSEWGVGSTFWFVARFELAQDARPPVLPSTHMDDAVAVLRGKQVLVVDDNEFNLEVARGLLEDLGVLVSTAENGAQALAAVSRTRFDCVLMDMQMPVMDGVSAARLIRSQPATAELVVIAMTANAGEDDQKLCLQAGMNEVVTKPIDPQHLFLTLARWLQGPYQPGMALPDAAALPRPVQPDTLAPVAWDDAALSRIVGDNPAAHVRLLDKFLLTAREALASIQSLAAGAQWAAVADQAHKLKSSARSVGAMELGTLCEALEHEGRGKEAAVCAALVQSVVQSYAQVDTHIRERRAATLHQPGRITTFEQG